MKAESRGSGVAKDEELLGGCAGFPNYNQKARRPLPAASPALGAGTGLARHLLRIDAAAAASRASPTPGMQRRRRRRQARRCVEGGGEGTIAAWLCLTAPVLFPSRGPVQGWGSGGRMDLWSCCRKALGSHSPCPETSTGG